MFRNNFITTLIISDFTVAFCIHHYNLYKLLGHYENFND